MIIALAGNPNSGKTTLFNSLTGSSGRVGNWPGVTVEHKEGTYKDKSSGEKITVTDLPGIYSLSPYTAEETVARDYLLSGKPSVLINIVDATNLERNLYLTTQLLELDIPLVIALNMTDAVIKGGGEIKAEIIEKSLGVPVVSISALKNTGITELMQAAKNAAGLKRKGYSPLEFFPVKKELEQIISLYEKSETANVVFRAVKLLEGDENEVKASGVKALEAEKIKASYIAEDGYENDFEALVADLRYKYICLKTEGAVNYKRQADNRSDKADKVLTHKIFGIPIFLGIMFAIFHLTFSENFLFLTVFGLKEGIMSPGVALQTGLGYLTGLMIDGVARALSNAPAWVSGLIVHGLLAGLDAVLSFLPQIILLFVFLSILEDCGYMARVAFIMDRVFRRFGLSGRAFMPLIMCFGCAVPGIMATRTLGNEKERKISILLAPFFSCGAKLPIWATVAAAVFPKSADLTVFSIYAIGIIVAVIAALLLSKTFFKGETPPFIMELPAYHMPRPKNTFMQAYQKITHYLFRAATVIAGAVVIIWVLSNISFTFRYVGAEGNESMLANIGSVLRILFLPLGFASGSDGWKFVVAIFTGLIAKEMVVASLGVMSGTDEALELGAGEIAGSSLGLLLSGLSGPAAMAFMAFNLLSVPCMAAVAAAHAEFKNKKFTLLAVVFWIATAFIVSLVIYWVGTLFALSGAVGASVILLASSLVVFTIVFNVTRNKRRKANGCGCGGCCGDCSGCNFKNNAKNDKNNG